MKYFKNSHLLNTCSVPDSPWSASTPFPLFFRPYVPLLCPLATERQPQWPPHCSLKTPSMLPSHGICACSCLEVSSSTYVHGLQCHFNRSSLKFIARERHCLTTFIPNSTFCYSLAFHIAFVSLHSSWHCLTIKYTSLFTSLVRMQAPSCGDFDSPFHRANLSV